MHMKSLKYLLWITCISLVSFGFKTDTQRVQSKPNDIIGTYMTLEKDAKVRIFLAKNGKYSGKTVWMREPNNEDGTPKKDVNNPNEKLRDRERMGLVFLKYFEYDADDDRWEGGTVYDPRSGKTYNGYLKFENGNKDKLLLRGYIGGMTWLGKTSEWTRVK